MSMPKSRPARRPRCSRSRKAPCSTAAPGKPSWSTRARAASSRARSSSAGAAAAMSRSREGLAEGEAVVTSANFLIDAESNLKAALKGFSPKRERQRNDRAPHRLVGPQPAAGAVRHRLCRRGRHLCAGPSAARRHSRSLRHPGHRLHRISGPGAAGDRGSGHLSADDGDADGAEIEGRARLLFLRRLVRLRHLRGRHRHLLGALARARIPQRRDFAIAGRRDADDRPGRDRRRLGLPVRGDVEGAEPRRHARPSRTGI